ncbi:MAG: hypothetical protein RL324_699 [Verrucomicrobiota bacterium]|jgi:integrase
MASLRRKLRSPFYFACYTGHDGARVQRSTKQSNRKKAQGVADLWEKAAKLASEKRLGEGQARRVLSEMYELVNNEPLSSATTTDFLNAWTERRKADTASRTHQAYAQVARDFLKSLGERASRDISQISKANVAKYRDLVLARTSAATANKSLKYLRVALGAAYKDGLIHDNPAAKLDIIKRRHSNSLQRRPFTIDELKTLLGHANEEWRGLILFGLYTGQRLRDVASLTWQNVDLQSNELRFVTRKTGRRMNLPLAAPALRYLQQLPAGDDPAAPLFPEAHKIAIAEGADSRLSQQFHGILESAGMADERSKKPTGKGRSRKRAVSEISFHSLRHTATSLLKNAGVPEAVAMDIIGHDSKAMSRHYTHVEQSSKRTALAGLPDITG